MACTITATELHNAIRALESILLRRGADVPIFPSDLAREVSTSTAHARAILDKLIRVKCIEKVRLTYYRNTYKVIAIARSETDD